MTQHQIEPVPRQRPIVPTASHKRHRGQWNQESVVALCDRPLLYRPGGRESLFCFYSTMKYRNVSPRGQWLPCSVESTCMHLHAEHDRGDFPAHLQG
eukprot:2640270-Amphidinium_carterae.2